MCIRDSVFFTAIINSLLKDIFQDPRPDFSLNIDPWLQTEASFGFPSGHTQIAVVIWLYIALVAKNSIVRTVSILFLLGVPLSRIYLGVHDVGDVLGGMIFGLITEKKVTPHLEDMQNYQNISNKQLAYVTQTTLSVDDTKEIIAELKRRFPRIKEPKKDDICYATTNRQSAVKKIASFCDMFFVIGSRNSSNSVRLVEVAKKSGCENSLLIHSEIEIPFDKIGNCKTIGISSGASVPDILVDEVIQKLQREFDILVKTDGSAREDMVFNLPPILRKR